MPFQYPMGMYLTCGYPFTNTTHEPECQITHDGSAPAMEAEGTVNILKVVDWCHFNFLNFNFKSFLGEILKKDPKGSESSTRIYGSDKLSAENCRKSISVLFLKLSQQFQNISLQTTSLREVYLMYHS